MFEQLKALPWHTFTDRATGLVRFFANRLFASSQTFDSDLQSTEKFADFSSRFGFNTRTGVSANWPLGLLGKSNNNLSTL